jgi:alkanesulfonate monooxygenase SsuD/methylene tetrahydromethanopterin reductase-like flavin-dependent oxidoreductase (luciferase family)
VETEGEAAASATRLRFGIWDWLDRPPGLPVAELYEQRLRVLEAAERAGFYCYHLAEHHGTPLSAAPSANLFFAAASQRTRRLRLGALVYLLPMYHPLRLVEEIAMLDHLTRGRLEVGVGRGASPYELAMFGLTPETAPEVFRETLDVLVQGLTTGDLTYQGRYFQFADTRTDLRPLQQPYPPLWYPTTNAQSIPWVAREGMNTIYGFGFLSPTLQDTREQLDQYATLHAAHAAEPGRLNGHVKEPRYGFTRQVYVAETDAQALREARAAFADFFANFNYLWALHDNDRYSGRVDFDRLVEQELILVGSPATVRAQLQRYVAAAGGNYFAGTFAFGSLTGDQILRSLDLFAREVMPAFRDPHPPRPIPSDASPAE